MFGCSKMLRLLAGMAATAFLLAGGATAQANPISIQYDLTGLPAAGGSIKALTLPQMNGGPVGIAYSGPNAGIVTGSSAGAYAAPVAGGSANSPTLWSAPYFSTGVGCITLTFAQVQTYFGLLWGSVDLGNSISFFDVNSMGAPTWLATITGNDIYTATQSSAAYGSQGYGGSYYIGLQDTGGNFNEVVLSSSVISFEAADIQYADATVSLIGIPEPATVSVLGVGVLGMLALRRCRRRSRCRMV